MVPFSDTLPLRQGSSFNKHWSKVDYNIINHSINEVHVIYNIHTLPDPTLPTTANNGLDYKQMDKYNCK